MFALAPVRSTTHRLSLGVYSNLVHDLVQIGVNRSRGHNGLQQSERRSPGVSLHKNIPGDMTIYYTAACLAISLQLASKAVNRKAAEWIPSNQAADSVTIVYVCLNVPLHLGSKREDAGGRQATAHYFRSPQRMHHRNLSFTAAG